MSDDNVSSTILQLIFLVFIIIHSSIELDVLVIHVISYFINNFAFFSNSCRIKKPGSTTAKVKLLKIGLENKNLYYFCYRLPFLSCMFETLFDCNFPISAKLVRTPLLFNSKNKIHHFLVGC